MASNDDSEPCSWINEIYTPDSNGLVCDPIVGPFFDRPHPANDVRNGRYLEADEGYMMLSDDYSRFYEEGPKYVSSAATQTSVQTFRTRKIKPVKRPGLVLKTPIAYERDTDLSVIPIEKDGMAVCEQCGAIGVKHAFYTKLRRFCSQACARECSEGERTVNGKLVENDPSSSMMMDTSLTVDKLNKKLKTESLDFIEPVPTELPQELFPFDSPSKVITTSTSPRKAANQLEKPVPSTYQWHEVMNDPEFNAAPVICFKHAPGYNAWHYVSVGMKVEVENTDCEDYSELLLADSFWVASVLRISGYCVLLRYIGFAENSEKDFWVNFCSAVVNPVGWCAMRGKPLIPPKSIEYQYTDWKRFLSKNLSGARTLPSNFITKVQLSLESRFRVNMVVEVVDKNRISQVKVATIIKIVGKRLQVRYYDSGPEDDGFVCHEDSPLLHPVGWARAVGATIDAPPDYMDRCNNGQWTDDDATLEYFIDSESTHCMTDEVPLKVGMKLEAIDPLNLSSICVATVMQELQENFVMIRIDSYAEDSTNSDWFCYHASSPCIFPAGFCNVNDITLTPPKGYTADTFNWPDYLEETGLMTAPLATFHREIPNHGFKVGMRVEAADLMDPRLVCVGTVARVVGRLLKVHFDGWEEEYDQWLDCESPDIYPVGWCQAVRHKLEGPRGPGNARGTTPALSPGKSSRGVKRKVGRRHKKAKTSASSSPSSGKAVGSPPPPPPPAPSSSMGAATATVAAAAAKCVQAVQPTAAAADNGVPDGNGPPLEPEMGQEPAGPDQSLPVSTEPNQLPGIPRERTATSYINSMGSTGKLIPRLVDGTGTTGTEPGELVPNEWNVYDVAQFLRVNDCATYCDSFSKRKIDGKALINLSKDQIIDLTGMKVGPSLKIFDLIQQLKIKVNPAAERLKAFKKIIS